MLKSIPKSNISQKRFPVYKEWVQTNIDSPIIQSYDESTYFDTETSTKSNGIYVSPLYNSTKSKYYTSDGNVFTQHGIVRNPGSFSTERIYSDLVYIIQIPQIRIGEQIKKGSLILEDHDNELIYVDDGFGGLTTEQALYSFISYDIDTQLMVFSDDTGTFDIVLSTFDTNTGIGTFTYNSVTDSTIVVLQLDFQTGLITFSQTLNFGGSGPSTARIGNIFYDEGLIVLTNSPGFSTYTLSYRSTVTIHETEILISVDIGEFNYSQNPTAVEVSLFSSSSFQTTRIGNLKNAQNIIIKEVNDISRKPYYEGSVGSHIGTWNDYLDSGSQDPTGSYLTPYITTIGLYDENFDMIAVAKLPKPIKNLPDWSLNFIIRLDT